MATDPLISVKDLNYSTDNNNILINISFDIYRREFVGIIGPNGAGKSTLIKTLIGEVQDYTGEIKINGKIGYVPQSEERERDFPIKVYEVALMGLYSEVGPFKRFKEEHYEKVRQTLKLLQIEHLYDRLVGRLSGGEYRRLMVARALVSDPDILILDEPEANIDKEGQNILYGTLRDLKKNRDMSIILISHDLNMIFKETNKIMCMNKTLHCHKNTADLDINDLRTLYSKDFELFIHINEKMKVVSNKDD
ncbi:metal ABC transporter ATP-binding protein [Petrotoga sp. 8T1HF07.NaAc.6.1]|jgi:zinc transport system ATP-binding protein|uniref:metal ABC transporter ATP-binding protein n=1 Tax=Petrotoga sp. 8T1HF07.NaAc.6.1 TaxID=1351838 RepID=UPI00192AB21C|nr:ABC transporter ATP-binding protein [Petrotoga sp. 8T1HF07.NaAc.6.1]MBL5980734.1 metal ABC transporter ATP-binding protein [Petrotoga sp. 8T1HF07.NaAc.6.1]